MNPSQGIPFKIHFSIFFVISALNPARTKASFGDLQLINSVYDSSEH